MKTIRVNLSSNSYNIYIDTELLGRIGEYLWPKKKHTVKLF